jgi:hypothetical protein
VLAAGDTVSNVHLLDLLKLSAGRYATSGKSRLGEGAGLVGWLAGPGGLVRQLVVHPLIPNVLACVGLDHKLWTWDVAAAAAAPTTMRPMTMTTMQLRLHRKGGVHDSGR